MVDFAVIVILFLSGLIAFYRGFVRESLGLGAWIAATLAGLYGYGFLSPAFGEVFKSEMVSNIIAGVVIALAVLIILTIIIGMITKSVRTSMLNGQARATHDGGRHAALLQYMVYHCRGSRLAGGTPHRYRTLGAGDGSEQFRPLHDRYMKL